jgi:hypothetical protein
MTEGSITIGQSFRVRVKSPNGYNKSVQDLRKCWWTADRMAFRVVLRLHHKVDFDRNIGDGVKMERLP